MELAIGARDHDVLLLLDAMQDGAFSRDDLLADTGMTLRRYRNTRLRLATYVGELPQRLVTSWESSGVATVPSGQGIGGGERDADRLLKKTG